MSLRTALCLVVLALIFIRYGFSAEIQGRVVSTEGKPVAEAVVLHRPSGIKVLTTKDGSFHLDIPAAGLISLEVIHPDFLEEMVSVPAEKAGRFLSVVLVPYIKQKEEIVVTALRYPEPSLKVPAASSVVSSQALAESLTPNLTQGTAGQPGISSLGTGGFSLVPVIRGLSRNRVLFLVDFARISSDRRTGPNASFISLEDMAKVEISRSPSSVFYGSDAIGGVFQVFLKEAGPREGVHGRLHARYGSVNQEKGLGLSLYGKKEGLGFYLSLQGLDAEDYHNASGRVLESRYSQWSLLAKATYRSEKRELDLSFLGGRGLDIGKPARDSQTRPTWYPRENHNLVQLRWQEKGLGGGDLTVHAFINPNALETRTDRLDSSGLKTKESFSRTESLDFGLQMAFDRKVARPFRLSAGLDFNGRAEAGAENRELSLDSQGVVTSVLEERPYQDGSRRDLGFFLSADYSGIKNLDVIGGLRWDHLWVKADPGGMGSVVENTDSALSGFAAASYRLASWLVAFVNFSRAYRAPTLSERFYTGITGRGFIIAQPGLAPEKSLNLDVGLKVVTSRFFAGLYGFLYEIDGLIERYLVAERTYTYGNVDKGRIQGLEFEGEWFPLSGWKLFGNISTARGKSLQTDQPLNDIPPFRIQAGTRVWVQRFSFELNASYQDQKTDPGPAEISIPASTLANARISYYLPPSLNLYVGVFNIFDALYLGRPDPDAPQDPGRNFMVGLNYSF